MPIKRASKKVTKKSYRAAKKKYIKQRGKWSRMKKYHKKSKRKIKWSKKQSIYRMKGIQGLKWTSWMTLADFLCCPNFDIMRELGTMVSGESTVDGTPPIKYFYMGGGRRWRPLSTTSARLLLARIFTVFSTKMLDPFTMAGKATRNTDRMFWKAWNPVLWQYTCGPLFDTYINMYKFIKFVGVKVHYYPVAKPVSMNMTPYYSTVSQNGVGITSAPSNSNATAIGGQITSGPLANYNIQWNVKQDKVYEVSTVPTYPTTWKTAFPESNANDDPPMSSYAGMVENYTISSQIQNPPIYRLWINFSKQGYESTDDVYVKQNYNSTTNERIKDNRIKLANVYKDGKIITNNFSKVKSYRLDKPFKFFVRPRLTSKLYEAPENETVLNNDEGEADEFDQAEWRKGQESTTQLVTSNKKFPYISVNKTYPFGHCPGITGINEQNYSRDVSMAFDDTLFLNPILFGWMLTRDDLPPEEYEQPFICKTSGDSNYSQPLYPVNFDWKGSKYLENLGKFKVTFYVKFRGVKNKIPTLSLDNALINAMNENDMQTV